MQRIKSQRKNIIDSKNFEGKCCPKCNTHIKLSSGCNHIECPCGTHFCYECGIESNLIDIYNHMQNAHGRIYSYEEPDYDDNYY